MKVLIISHNPLTTYHNMGKTLLSLFSGFKREELCQLYIYPSLPDVEACNSYFQITDKDVLRSYYRFSVKGKEIFPDLTLHTEFTDENEAKLYRNPKNKTAFRILARDWMWKFAHWYNKPLKKWLEREKPTCIFVAPGDGKFVYDIALKISKKYNLPIVSYVCDEYYFVHKPKGLLNKIRQRALSKKIEKLYSKVSHIITICDELNTLYSEKFGVSATTVMTATSYPIVEEPKLVAKPKTITYMGNLRLNRYVSLAEIGWALDELNRGGRGGYKLRIYSAETDEGILSVLKGIESIDFCGFVTGDEFDKVFHSSEVLLHTEAFDEPSKDFTKHSVSTKIGDVLGSGICLFAYGPAEIASIRHLKEHDCAFVCTEKTSLKEILGKVFTDIQSRKNVQCKALDTARKYHSSLIQRECVRGIFLNLQ